ncbi:MAG: hypothetical protein AAGJ93_03705 [Bacteroidota bacterium]
MKHSYIYPIVLLLVCTMMGCEEPDLVEQSNFEVTITMDGKEFNFTDANEVSNFIQSDAYQAWVYYIENEAPRNETACASNGVCVTCQVIYIIGDSHAVARCDYSDGREPTYHII